MQDNEVDITLRSLFDTGSHFNERAWSGTALVLEILRHYQDQIIGGRPGLRIIRAAVPPFECVLNLSSDPASIDGEVHTGGALTFKRGRNTVGSLDLRAGP